MESRRSATLARLTAIAADLSGYSREDLPEGSTFIELGFDSLFMTQLATTYQEAFGIKLSFRQMIDEYPTLGAMADYVAASMPPAVGVQADGPVGSAAADTRAAPSADPAPAATFSPAPGVKSTGRTLTAPAPGSGVGGSELLQSVIRQQLAIMERQLSQLQRATGINLSDGKPAAAPGASQVASTRVPEVSQSSPTESLPSNPSSTALTPAQRHHVDRLLAWFEAKTPSSASRLPRVSSGPRSTPDPVAGISTYRLTVARAQGGWLWDIDGNQYLDLTGSPSAGVLGHASDVVISALKHGLERMATLSQSSLAGESETLLRALTGMAHVRWTSSGNDAVRLALHAACASSGRRLTVAFGDAASAELRRLGAEVLSLGFGTEEAVATIVERAAALAAVLVDPLPVGVDEESVRRFIQRLRSLTRDKGIALVFDERTSGLRMHPGGAQGFYGVQADLAVYESGLAMTRPLGAVLSMAPLPELPVDGLAATPGVAHVGAAGDAGMHALLAFVSTQATLQYLKQQGPSLQGRINHLASRLRDSLQRVIDSTGAPVRATSCGPQVSLQFQGDVAMTMSLLRLHLLARGMHVRGDLCILPTAAHTEQDVAAFVSAFEDSVHDLQDGGFLQPVSPRKPSTWRRAFPMTESQKELWFASQISDLASCAFNESDAIRITGPLDATLLSDVVAEVLGRHEALRLRFDTYGEMQLVDPAASFAVNQADFSSMDGRRATAELEAIVDREALQPFDLANGPMARAWLVRMPGQAHVLLLYFHHIVFDGYSGRLLMQEIADAYSARRNGREPSPSAASPYSVFVFRSRVAHDKQATARSLGYWQSRFTPDLPPPLELPTDRPRGPVRDPSAATIHRDLGPELLQSARALARANGTTLFALLLAAFHAVLGRLSGQDDVVVAIPSAGQAHVGVDTVGYCVTTLPVRARPAADKPLARLAAETQKSMLDALDHQDVSLGAIIRSLRLPTSRARLPLVEVMFNFSSFLSDLSFDGCTVVAHENRRRATFYDMFLHIVESDGRLIADWDYRTDLFDAATIERWLDMYCDLLRVAARSIPGQAERSPATTETQASSLAS